MTTLTGTNYRANILHGASEVTKEESSRDYPASRPTCQLPRTLTIKHALLVRTPQAAQRESHHRTIRRKASCCDRLPLGCALIPAAIKPHSGHAPTTRRGAVH